MNLLFCCKTFMDYFLKANHSVSFLHSCLFNSACLLIVYSGDTEVNLGPEIKNQLSTNFVIGI